MEKYSADKFDFMFVELVLLINEYLAKNQMSMFFPKM